MKRMELKIALTFVVMFVVTFIINSTYSVVSLKEGFCSAKILTTSLYHALPYLAFFWVNLGRNKLLRFLPIIGALLLMNFSSYITGNYPFRYSGFGWIDIAIPAVLIVAYVISDRQAKEFLEITGK